MASRAALTAAVTAVMLLAFAGTALAAGPLSWSAAQNVDGTNTIVALDCPSTALCVAGDASGNVITSANPAGGVATWTVSNLVGGFVSINSVDCPTTTLCVAVDSAGSVWWSTNPNGGAAAWTEEPVYGGAGGLKKVSCPSTTLCLVTTGSNGSIYWSTAPTGVGTWTQVQFDGTNAEFALSCPTTTLCVTGNDVGDIWWTTNPTGLSTDWTQAAGVGFGVLESLSCVGTGFCVGADDSGNVVTTSNPKGAAGAWTVTNIAGGGFMFGISCPTASLCVTGAGTDAYTSLTPLAGAAGWQTDTLASTLRTFACPTTAFCLAAGNSGNLYVGLQPTLGVTLAGSGTGSVSGSGIACPGTCSFVYPLNTALTLTANPAGDGSTFAGWSGACTGTGTCDLTMTADRAVTATFDPPAPPPADPRADPPAQPAQVPPPPADLPPPTPRQTANAYPESGTVLVKTGRTFVKLTRPEQVQFGATFDTRRGAVTIVVKNARGGLDTATFSEGQFKLVAVGGIAELRLVGGNFKGCPKAARGGAAAAGVKRGKNVRHLWGEGSGSFRTKGRFASATIRGTKWLTDDYCRGTLIKVAVGAVTVRDLVKRKTLAVRARKSYFAAARA